MKALVAFQYLMVLINLASAWYYPDDTVNLVAAALCAAIAIITAYGVGRSS